MPSLTGAALAAHLDAHAARTADRTTCFDAASFMGEQISPDDLDDGTFDVLFGALDAPGSIPAGCTFQGYDGAPYQDLIGRESNDFGL